MSRYALALLVGLLACTGKGDPSEPPRSWEEASRVSGSAERGFGAAVAYVGDELRIGQPWQGPGQVLDGRGQVVLSGVDGDRLGETLLGGASLVIGAPGQGTGGALLQPDGQVLLAGLDGDHLGGAPVQHDGQLVALGAKGAHGTSSRWDAPGPLWSLVSARVGGDEVELVGGLVSGGIAWPGSAREAGGALGRGLLACDLDGDGDDELVLADPLDGRVHVYTVDDLQALSPSEPSVAFSLGPGAGRTLACFRGGLLVGAPDRLQGGSVAWIRTPLEADAEPVWIAGGAGSRLGHAIAVHTDRVAVGDPGLGQVRELVPRR